ncbi:MAG TPA: SCO family protein [Desulfuromonadales bacterium]|jgi:protein SCO1/2
MNFFLQSDTRRLLVQGRKLLLVAAFTLLATAGANSGENTGPGPVHQAGHGETAEPAKEHVHVHPQPAAATEVGLDEKLGAAIPLDLTFRDETGRTVTLRDLVTVPTIIAPVYYKCPNVCSFLQGGLAQALPEVKLEPGKAFRVLSVSFDETETPELAHRSQAIYLDAMRQRFPAAAWSFLTGDPENIRSLLDAAGYRFQRQGEDFLHPVAIFVVASDGKIVRYLHGTSVLPMDLTLALVEASEGRIGPTIRRVAQFCFSYDAENRRYVFNLFRVSATVILLTAGAFLSFLILRGRKNPDRPR